MKSMSYRARAQAFGHKDVIEEVIISSVGAAGLLMSLTTFECVIFPLNVHINSRRLA